MTNYSQIIVALLLFSCFSLSARAQFGSSDQLTLNEEQLEFHKPQNFTNIEFGKNWLSLNRAISPSMTSLDGNLLVCFDIPTGLSVIDPAYDEYRMWPTSLRPIPIQFLYIHYIRQDFKWSRGTGNTSTTGGVAEVIGFLKSQNDPYSPPSDLYTSTNDLIERHSSSEALRRFNADSLITYDLPLKEGLVVADKYNYCYVIQIQKKDRGFVLIHCFYNEAAKKKLRKYIKSLDKMFWYREPEDFIKFKFPEVNKSDVDVIVIPR